MILSVPPLLQAKTGRQTMCFQSILPSKKEIKTSIHGNEWRQRWWWLITLPVALLGPNWTTRIDPYANRYCWMCLVLSKLHWESRHNNYMIVGGSNDRYYGEDAQLGRRWWCAHSQLPNDDKDGPLAEEDGPLAEEDGPLAKDTTMRGLSSVWAQQCHKQSN